MAAGTPPRKPWTLVLAAVLLFAVLAPITPTADAASSTDLRIATGPFFAARPAKEGAATVTEHRVDIRPDVATAQIRVIEVFNPKPVITTGTADERDNNDITEVQFRYTLAADPGSPDAPGLSHAFRWDSTGSNTNGWGVIADNAANSAGEHRLLTFAGGRIPPQTTARFNIGILANSNSVGDLPDPTKQERYPVQVKALTEILDDMTTSDPVSFRIVVDNSQPDLLAVTTRDANYDGKLDRIQLSFSEAMDPATFFRHDFLVRDNTVTPPYDYTVAAIELPKVGQVAFEAGGTFTLLHTGGPTGAGATLPTTPTSIDGEKTAFLVLTARGGYDTGVVPDLIYDAPGVVRANFNLTDLSGHKLKRTFETAASMVEVDGAKPVLVGVASVVGSDSVNMVFSEPVRGTFTADSRIQQADLVYNDYAAGSPNNAGALTAFFDPVTHTVGLQTGNTARLVLKGGVTMGSGDVCPFPGANCDGINLKTVTPAPTSCTLPDFAPCAARIEDMSGGKLKAVTLGGGLNSQSVLAPRVALKAQVNNDANKVTIDFTVPVSDASGDSVPVKLSSFDVVAADGTGQGPAGVILAQQVDGKQVILTLDKKTRATDLDDTPARIRIVCNSIKVTGLANVFIPCFDPDGDGRPDIDMEDRTRPAIREARTVDGNRNGVLDGLFLIMNEPVDDSSFCLSLLPNPSGGPPAKTFQIPTSCDPANPDVVLDIDNTCGPYTWETNVEGIAEEALVGLDIPRDRDNQKNDRYGIIKFPETCPGFSGPRNYSDDIPRIRTRSEGLFADLSPFNPTLNVRKMVPICEGKDVGSSNCARWTDSDIVNFVCPTGAPATCPEDPPEYDRAPPVIMWAKTVDSHDDKSLEGNGLIDGYKLHFSEPVDDSSFRATDWKVAGHNVTIMRTADLHITDLNARVSLCRLTQSYKNDCEIIVHFDESGPGVAPDGDTDQTPQLTYRHAGGVGGFRDLAGNDMLVVDNNVVNEQDGSRPVIFRAEAQPLKDKIRLTFSEPVDNGARGALVRADFTYSNANGKDVPGMNDQAAIQHTAGSRTALISMTGAMTQSDIDSDCIAADQNAVLEVAPTLAVADKQWATVTCHKFTLATDLEPPAMVSGLAVVPEVTTANSITLTFTAPGDDGDNFGTVTKYAVKVSTSAINATNFFTVSTNQTKDGVVYTDGAKTPTTTPLLVEAEPATLVSFGKTQRLTVSGLEPETAYFLSVVAFDEVRLQSPVAPHVTATTGKDVTPPPMPVPFSGVVRGGITSQHTITFQWDPVRDDESKVSYRYALNGITEYVMKKTDNSTTATTVTFPNLPSGNYVFHIAAVSGGGSSGVAHYPFTIGFATVDQAAIKLATERVKFTAERLDNTNTITWTLPANRTLVETQAGMKFEGIRIVRLDGSAIAEVHRVKGSYESLKTGKFDDAQGTDKSAYRVEVVFAEGQTLSEKSLQPKFEKVVDVTPKTFELAGLLASLAILLVAGLVVGIVIYLRRGAAKPAPAVLEEPPAGVDASTGMPTHDVQCPNCQTPFQAVGLLPLQIHCPKCGVTGVLQ